MADSEQYDSSVSNNLASQNANATSKAADDQKTAEEKGAAGAASAVKLGSDRKAAAAKTSTKADSSIGRPDASATPMAPPSKTVGDMLKGAVKNMIHPSKPAMPNAGAPAASPAAPVTPAGTVGGGNTQISVDSMKGQALTQDPKANLASKGRFSDYRKVFSARGAAGKHPWGSK